jgi:large subunit ribosomal protein L30e
MIDVEKAIGTAVKTGKVVLGANEAVRNAQSGKTKLIVIAANCPAEIRGDIECYSRLSDVNVVVYKGTSIDLGMACGKPFMVSALSVKEPGDSDILRWVEEPSLEEEEEAEESPFEPAGFEEEAEGAGAEEEEIKEADEQFEADDSSAEEEGAGHYAAEDDEDLGEDVND